MKIQRRKKRRQRFHALLSQKYEIWLLCYAAELKRYPTAIVENMSYSPRVT